MSTLDKQDPAELQHQPPVVDPTIMWAMQNNATPDMLRELYQLQREMRADQARNAFYEAVAAFKAEPLHIVKDKENKQYSKDGKKAMYTSLENMVEVVTPLLSKHGLSASWDVPSQNAQGITVSCTLSHVMGYGRTVSVFGGPDKSGAKNDLQQLKSSMTYLKIATFESVCGLASSTGNLSDDGNASGIEKPGLPNDEIERHLRAITEAKTHEELREVWSIANKEARKVKDVPAAQEFASQGEKRKAEL